jgi:hypothetical protein
MSPPGLLAATRSGGTTSLSKPELINAARLVLSNKGPAISGRAFIDVVVTKPPTSPNTTRLTQGLAAMTRPLHQRNGVEGTVSCDPV